MLSCDMDSTRKRTMVARKTRMGEDSDRADREFWASLSPDERILESWRLTVELWQMSCFIGRDVLMKNERALGRPRDLADLEALGE